MAACQVGDGIPAGKQAVVGPTLIGPEDVAAAKSQMGAYGQLRFAGPEGDATMLETLVAAELLALEAKASGLGRDARVEFSIEEEIAGVHLSTLLERAVPREQVEADGIALRAYYDEHLDAFELPERRSLQGVVFRKYAEAEQALAALQGGTTTLAELGDVVATPLQARDDEEFPAFHKALFAKGIAEGDWVSQPVYVGGAILVGRVQKIEEATPERYEDAGVQERLVEAVLAPRRDAAKAKILAGLRANAQG